MELRDVLRERFPSLTQETAIEICRARGACADGLDWLQYQPDAETVLRDAPIRFLSWFAAPFLRRADLHEADLRGANLHEADLRGANLREAKYDEYTRWPAGYTPREE
jgi:hypothetical protein